MSGDTLYGEAAYYRMLFRERTHDVAFYRRVTEGVDRALELGVGDGRMATALAREGRTIRGVDASASMLAALEERLADEPEEVRRRVVASEGDTLSLRLGERFDRVLCPFNGFAHFHDAASQAAALETVRAHLAPGGRFAFDVMLPDPKLLAGGASSVPRLEHPRTGAICRMEETYEYDAMAQVLTIETHLVERETGDRQVLRLSLRQLFPQETQLLLEHHGFRILERSEELGDSVAWICEVSAGA